MQGPEQEVVAQIKEALKRASAHPGVDVLVLTRGGGALEDLWLFHNEDLCRFISQAPLPIVVAIGHEKNHLLAEEAGDARVSTPTYAAMRVIPDVRALRQQLEPMIQALHVSLERQGGAKARRLAELTSVLSAPSLDRQRQRLEGVMYQLEVSARDALERKDRALSQAKQHLTERSPLAALARFDEGFREGARALERVELLAAPTTALTHSAERLESAAQARLERATHELHTLIAELHALSPLAVLSRGYSITTRANSSEVLHDASSVSPGERVTIQLSEGRLEAEVTHVSPAPSP
jgi:exodeoxyribonuclease VII large subunit